jgi:hypothetical protein
MPQNNIDTADAFIAEIRAHPKFIAGCQADNGFLDQVDSLEEFLLRLCRADRAEMIEASDEVCGLVGRCDVPIKQRLLGVLPILTRLKDSL